MNDPKLKHVDVEEQREWLKKHKAETGLSWRDLGARLDINDKTLALFASNKYGAPGDFIAEAIFRHRQTLAAQAAMALRSVEIPPYYPTRTSLDLIQLLAWGQRGRIVMAAMGPGMSKTTTARHFKACNSGVFMVTISPATSGIRAMERAVLHAMGDSSPTGDIQNMAMQIKDRVAKMQKPLLIVDEAQHLTVQSIEELRHWHDETGLGLALLGNQQVQQKLDGGARASAFAQLFSRLANKLDRPKPLDADVEAMLDAWGVCDPRVAKEVHRIAALPGALRGATFALELASMLAISQNETLSISHINDAWAQLSRRTVGT